MKVFVEYQDDKKIVKGMFDLIEQTSNYVKIKSGKNILTIPFHKINKMKQSLKGGKDKI